MKYRATPTNSSTLVGGSSWRVAIDGCVESYPGQGLLEEHPKPPREMVRFTFHHLIWKTAHLYMIVMVYLWWFPELCWIIRGCSIALDVYDVWGMIFRLFNPSVHSTLYQSPFWGQLPRHLCRDGGGLGPWASPGFRGPSGTRTQSRPLTRQEDDMQQLLAESVLFKAAGSGVSRLGSRAPCETGVFFFIFIFHYVWWFRCICSLSSPGLEGPGAMSTACRSAKTRSGWIAGDTGDTAMVESKVCLCVFISHMYINKQYINIRNIYIYILCLHTDIYI